MINMNNESVEQKISDIAKEAIENIKLFAEYLDKSDNKPIKQNLPPGLVFYLDYKYDGAEMTRHVPMLQTTHSAKNESTSSQRTD